jgi:hypothetical protein
MAAMEVKFKLDNGQFRPSAYQLDLYTQISILLCQILNQFLPILHGYTIISIIQPITSPTQAYLEIKIGGFNP